MSKFQYNTDLLLGKPKGCTGKYWPRPLQYRPSTMGSYKNN